MNFRRILFILASCISSVFGVRAEGIIDTEYSSSLFTFGVRAGVNTSVHTFPSEYFDKWNVNTWGAGFEAGAVIDLNIRRYLAIQPGFFFNSRSGNYSYIQSYTNMNGEADNFVQLGHYRAYFLNIPVMVSVRLSIADNVKWLIEAGPYLQLKLHSSDSDDIDILEKDLNDTFWLSRANANSSDFGLKIGSGILVNNHYSFSIHYLAGMRNVWKEPFAGGRNKAWTFTLGYNF